MKKFIILSILALVAVLPVFSQAKSTVYLNGGNALDLNVTKWYAYNYKSSVTDRLVPATANVHDTTDYILMVKNQNSGPLHFYAAIELDTVGGADTTVNVGVWYKEFANQDYAALIAAASTAGEIRNDTVVVRTTLGVTTTLTATTAGATDTWVDEVTTDTDTLTVAARTTTTVVNPVLYYRYLKFRLCLVGNDHSGVGVKVKRIEIQFFN